MQCFFAFVTAAVTSRNNIQAIHYCNERLCKFLSSSMVPILRDFNFWELKSQIYGNL